MKLVFKPIFIKFTAEYLATGKNLYRPYIVFIEEKYLLHELSEYRKYTKKL